MDVLRVSIVQECGDSLYFGLDDLVTAGVPVIRDIGLLLAQIFQQCFGQW
jgi:hypothetical protein